ncbi:MAG TPA: hypothetical protein VHO70_01100 [Chitinispirillaceae bacterium]|nr:hypothetical protein [Chitinispirillaceae bacterium]
MDVLTESLKSMESNTTIVRELTDTFNYQVRMYRELTLLVQKMIGNMVLSRGDMSGLLSSMEKKKKMLELIEIERHSHSDAIMRWQLLKNNVTMTSEVSVLEKVLEDTGCAIKEFINEEEQLRTYIEKCMQKS